MVQCRFFMQGFCKYGAGCRFEHSAPRYGASNVSPLLRQNQQPTPSLPVGRNTHANNSYRPHGPPKKDTRDIFNLMAQDITEAEKGGVWPLSCYNFWPAITYGNNVPGLEDLSPEEMRHLQMQAQASGNLEACNHQIQQMYQQARAKFNALKVQSPETLATIENAIRGPAAAQTPVPFPSGTNTTSDNCPAAAPFSPFSSGQPSIFGGTAGSISALPSQVQNYVSGGTSGSVNQGFGLQQPSVFGGTNSQQQQQQVFAAAVPFASSGQNQSIFGGASQQTQAPSFGATAHPYESYSSPSIQASIFGGATAQQTSFGASPSAGQTSGSLFGIPSTAAAGKNGSFYYPASSAFGVNSAPVQASNASPFGAPAATGNLYGGTASNPHPSVMFGGGFASSQNTNVGNSQLSSLISNSTIYTALENLTELERREFEAETFTLGKIPTHPPPQNLC